tara:strand:+ start:4273 stop:5517 length:1245 start_codon:yes stop_codon:yes gene_type:complete
MKILFIAPEIPWPLNKGTCQRTYALLKTLSREHQVTFSAPVEGDYTARLDGILPFIHEFIPVPLEALQRRRLPNTGNRLIRFLNYGKSLLSSKIPYACQMEQTLWHDCLYPKIELYDLFFCRYAYLTEVFSGVPRSRMLVDADDLQFMRLWRKAVTWKAGFESILLGMEALRSRFFERRLARQTLQTFVCSEVDRRKLGEEGVSVIRNGVDISGRTTPNIAPEDNSLLFIGAFTYEPNRAGLEWFCREVWPLIMAENSHAKLRVAGYGMDQVDMRYAEQDGIRLLGEIADPAVAILEAQLMVVPILFGTGTRVKIAEALGYGRPVVSTTMGAEGYEDFTEKNGLFRCDDPLKMADQILALLDDQAACLSLGREAKRIAKERLDWNNTTAPLLRFTSLGDQRPIPELVKENVDEP